MVNVDVMSSTSVDRTHLGLYVVCLCPQFLQVFIIISSLYRHLLILCLQPDYRLLICLLLVLSMPLSSLQFFMGICELLLDPLLSAMNQ
jgi:hypothetical protein